ncbi:hypothetical protein [Actinacidiphila sp. ITFR-21]|uniref:hypothetical protein n=1 Tax=Actinacidiphila sp. ITFR-21 TaxID=3075199 RepID=UPI0028897FB4|nr:hypothetical protein [Streptomyces sp. ITFR-21]WNI20218.1 hypothetical protein RLT57_32250 [Streptomyces sp. ITFR-21]
MTVESPSPTDEFADDTQTAERASEAIKVMVTALDTMVSADGVLIAPGVSPRVFPIAYGWFAAVVRNSQLIALAHHHGLRHECAANARLILQHTLALQWLVEGGEPAAAAVEDAQHRQMHALIKEVVDTKWPVPAGLEVPSGSPPPKKGRLAEDFENFKHMCQLYDGGPQLYVPYKLTSSNAHPSYTGAMAYLVPDTGQLSTTAVTDTYAHLIDSTRCLIQAGHAFAPLLADTAVADAVGEAERTLGMQFGLWQRLP